MFVNGVRGCKPDIPVLFSALIRGRPVRRFLQKIAGFFLMVGWAGARFLNYCVKQGWLRQEGPSGRGTKWYQTDKGEEELKEKFEIEL